MFQPASILVPGLIALLPLGAATGVPLRKPDLVELGVGDPHFRLDIHYARTDNFMGRRMYRQARAFLQRPAAQALARVARGLSRQGMGLLIFDGYRPWSVTKAFWDATPPEKRMFVADPGKGSRHNRGCAVDLSLFDLGSGRPLEMPSDYDEMSERAWIGYAGATPAALENRERLRGAMEAAGFKVYSKEWWHFEYQDWRHYPILDIPFEQLPRAAR